MKIHVPDMLHANVHPRLSAYFCLSQANILLDMLCTTFPSFPFSPIVIFLCHTSAVSIVFMHFQV